MQAQSEPAESYYFKFNKSGFAKYFVSHQTTHINGLAEVFSLHFYRVDLFATEVFCFSPFLWIFAQAKETDWIRIHATKDLRDKIHCIEILDNFAIIIRLKKRWKEMQSRNGRVFTRLILIYLKLT